MATIVPAVKTVSFKTPYTGKTFQQLTDQLLGRDGYLSGGFTSDDGSLITMQAATFVQRGIIAAMSDVASDIAVPTTGEPWFMIGGITDDDPDSGVAIAVTTDLGVAATSVILAYKVDGRWNSPVPVDVASAAIRNSEAGVEAGFGTLESYITFVNPDQVETISVFKGTLVDPVGNRRELGFDEANANAGVAAAVGPGRPHPTLYRTDHAVLRQCEPYSGSIQSLIGKTHGASTNFTNTTLDTVISPADRPAYWAFESGQLGQQYYAWGDNTSLKVQGGPAGEGFAAATLLTSGVIKAVELIGSRRGDGALIVVFVEGLLLKMATFDQSTGALIDAAVTLATTGVQISNPRIAFHNQVLHIVFQNAETPQQIYYMNCPVASSGFGTIGITPRYVAGSVTITNDTWPSIGVDRSGIVTVAYIQGSSTNEFGDLMVATIDQTGTTVDMDLAEAASDVGIDLFPVDATSIDVDVDGGYGAVATAMVNVRRTAVVVTPFDEVCVFTLGLSTGSAVDYLLLYRPEFDDAHGFKVLNLAPRGAFSTETLTGLAAVAGEQGDITVATKADITAGPATRIDLYALNPRPMELGRISLATVVSRTSIASQSAATGFTNLGIGKGPTGDVVVNYAINLTVVTSAGPALSGKAFAGHPKDVYLASWVVPPHADQPLPAGQDPGFQIYAPRPKRMSYPFLVGNQGSYQGYEALHQAAKEAALVGGDIVVRGGRHQVDSKLRFMGAVRGEGRAVLIVTNRIELGRDMTGVAVTISGNLLTSADSSLSTVRAGSAVVCATSGLHMVARNLGFDPATNLYRILLDNNTAGVPVGSPVSIYTAGLELENLTAIINLASPSVVSSLAVRYGYQARVRDLRLEGTNYFQMDNCLASMVDNIDVTGMANAGTDKSIHLTGGDDVIVRNARMADGKGRLTLDVSCQNIVLSGCHSDGADATQVIYDVIGTRTTPVFFSNCHGRFNGDVTDLMTNVGRRIRQPEAGGQLEFEDDNTRASAISDKGIKLTSTTDKDFNGSITDIITGAVNQRVRTAGDTMTGNLTLTGTAEVFQAVRLWKYWTPRLTTDSLPWGPDSCSEDGTHAYVNVGGQISVPVDLVVGDEVVDFSFNGGETGGIGPPYAVCTLVRNDNTGASFSVATFSWGGTGGPPYTYSFAHGTTFSHTVVDGSAYWIIIAASGLAHALVSAVGVRSGH
jgi:hypothetical protein